MKHVFNFNPKTTQWFDAALAITAVAVAAVLAPKLAHADDAVKFPDLTSSYLKTGDFIGPDHVRRIRPGLNKDQVRLEMGNPHFSEGLWGVREWDYALNFYTGKGAQGNDFVTCQYKVKFDDNYRVASTHWKDPQCAAYIMPAEAAMPVAAVVPAVVAAMPQRLVLEADGLFAFGKSGLDDLLAPGRDKLSALAGQIKAKAAAVASVIVTGHTDRVGSDSANQALSQARADTVRNFLMQQGLQASTVRAYGAGETQPVVQCPGDAVTPQLVQCLQPNRRIEVEAIAVQ